MTKDQHRLNTLNCQLQELLDSMNLLVQSQSWAELHDMDQQVNELVRTCVNDGYINEPSINRKVMFIARRYREMIAALSADRAAALEQINQDKQRLKVSACYQATNSACA